MDTDRWQRLKAHYQAASKLSGQARRAYLDAHLADDAAARADVESLLDTDRDSSESASLEHVVEHAIEQVVTELFQPDAQAGDTLGAYRIVRELGRGGMGTVWLATRDDDEYRTNVAIKVMHGLLGEDARARFLAERQMLANLNHPNIARLLDGGTTPDGAPYVVMEHVNGLPIDRYVKENALSQRQRIELFCAVCDAVQYAHRSLIVHRDLKPENILVTGDGQPKLLDFGIAKLLTTDIDAPQTVLGESMLTPRYASPEQVTNQSVTTATDVYALGVLLHTLLTEALPYRLESDDLFELARAICEDEPQRPSLTNPALRGDLDTIILKALRKEPDLRYASASDFADDLQRHLSLQPVLARPATAGYRLSRFVNRNRLPVALGVSALLGLLFATAFSYDQMQQAVEARQSAEYERSVAVGENVRTTLSSAAEAVESGDAVRAHRLLNRINPEDRNWVWSMLMAQLDQSHFSIMQEDAVAVGLWSDQGMVSVQSNGRVTWWDDTQESRSLDLPVTTVTHAHFAASGSRLVTADSTKEIVLWDLPEHGAPSSLFSVTAADTPVDVALSHNERELAIVTSDELSLWQVSSGERFVARLPETPTRLSLSADGSRVGVSFARNSREAYRVYNQQAELLVTADSYDIYALALHPEGDRSATSEGFNAIRFRETESTRVLHRYYGHRQPATELAFSGDGSRLVSSAPDRTLRFWKLDNTEQPVTLMGLSQDIERIHVDQTGNRVVSRSSEGQLKLWHREWEARSLSQAGRWVATHADNAQIYQLSTFGILNRYHSESLEPFDQITVGRLAATAFALSGSGNTLGVAERGRVLLLDSATLEAQRQFSLSNAEVIALAFAPNEQQLLSLQSNGTLSLIDVASGRVQVVEQVDPLEAGAVEFTTNGNGFVSATHGNITLRNSKSLKEIASYHAEGASALTLGFSRSAERLATGWDDGSVVLLNAQSLDEVGRLTEKTGAVTSLSFAAEDAILATGTSESEVWLWDSATGRPLLTLDGPGDAARTTTLAFTPDNRHLLAGYTTGEVRRWSITSSNQHWKARAELARNRAEQQPAMNVRWATRQPAGDLAAAIRRDRSLSDRQKLAALQLALTPPPVPRVVKRDPFDGYAMSFEGDDDHVLAANPDDLVMTPQFTLEMWVKPEAFPEEATPLSLRMLLNKEGEYQLALRHDGALLWTLASSDGWLGWVPTRYRLEHQVWTHLALVRDTSSVKIYLNAELIQEHEVPASIGDQHRYKNEFRIGGRQHTPSSMFGLLDEVRVWNSARTAAEIQAGMLELTDPTSPKLRASWSFDDGAGERVAEATDSHIGKRVGARWIKTRR